MRLIRSVRRPANFGSSLRFHRWRDTKLSSACLYPVLNNESNLVNGSKILGFDRLYAASAAPNALEDIKPNQRLSKNKRRALVETYVNEYRLTNEGKFPSVSDTRKKVGGGYYVVRQMVQELIYNSKQSSTDSDILLEKSTTKRKEMAYNSNRIIDNKDGYLEKNTMKKVGISSNFEEVHQTSKLGEDARPILKDIENPSSLISQPKHDDDQQFSVSVEDQIDELKDIGAQSQHLVDKSESSQDLDDEKEFEILEDKVKHNALEPNADALELYKIDEPKDVGAQSHHLIDQPESYPDLNYEKERRILEDKVKSNVLEHKADALGHKVGPLESTEVSGRRLEEMPPKHAESQDRSSMWNNLKSFANGIFSMWKRS